MNKEEIEDALFCLEIDRLNNKQIELLLNYIDKLQKELQYEKNEIMNLAGMLDEKDEEIKSLEIDLEIGNNMCGKLQKENETLKENNLSYQEELAKAWNKNEELKEKLKSKEKQIKLMQEMNLPDEIEKNYISKDKIRDKIKELEKTKNYITSMYAIGILEELLGDDE